MPLVIRTRIPSAILSESPLGILPRLLSEILFAILSGNCAWNFSKISVPLDSFIDFFEIHLRIPSGITTDISPENPPGIAP